MDNGASRPGPPEFKRAAAAEYLALEMSRLARMASANEFPLLPYLIDMAVLEAWREASETRVVSGEPRAE